MTCAACTINKQKCLVDGKSAGRNGREAGEVQEESTWGAVHGEEEVGEEKGKKVAKKGKGKGKERAATTPAEKVERRLRPQEIDPTLKELDSETSSDSASESEEEEEQTLLEAVRELQGAVVEMKGSMSDLADLAQHVKSETDNRTEFMRILALDFRHFKSQWEHVHRAELPTNGPLAPGTRAPKLAREVRRDKTLEWDDDMPLGKGKEKSKE